MGSDFGSVMHTRHLTRIEPVNAFALLLFKLCPIPPAGGLEAAQQPAQVLKKSSKVQTSKSRWRSFQFGKRIFQVFDRSMTDAAPPLVMRRRRLDKTLNEITPRLGMALPDLLPRFVRFPEFAGIEQCHTVAQIGAIFLTQLRREPRGVWGRRS